jgi:putative transposase
MCDEHTDSSTVPVVPQPEVAVPVVRPLAELLEGLHADRDPLGRLRAEHLRQVARELGCSPRTVRRRLDDYLAARDVDAGRAPFTLTDHMLQVVAAHSGNVAAAFDDLLAAGHALPSQTTFWRGFRRVPSDVRGYVLNGNQGMLAGTMFLRWEPDHRNEVWEVDHKEIPVEVIADGCETSMVKPWLTSIIDGKTRRVVGFSLTADLNQRPDADVVCAVLAEAMLIASTDTTVFGGLPTTVRCDQGAEFLGKKLSAFSNAAGFQVKPVMARSGHLKGKIERLFLTVDMRFSMVQPGYTEGPKTLSGKEPLRTTGDTPMPADELRRRLANFVGEYNDSPHSALDGRTPNEAWAADPTPLQQVPDAVLRGQLLLASKTPKMTTNGLNFASRQWFAPELHGRIGERFSVRFPIYHSGFIEVFEKDRDVWVCRALPQLDRSDRDRLRKARRDGYIHARGIMNAAAAVRVRASDAAALEEHPRPHVAAHLDDPFSNGLDDLNALTGLLDDAPSTADAPTDAGDSAGGDDDWGLG